ncbi:hypothetical protein KI387_020678, partial [Taxus chinensis]
MRGPAEKPPGGPRSNRDIWDRNARIGRKASRRPNEQSGHLGQKYATGAKGRSGRRRKKNWLSVARDVWDKKTQTGRIGRNEHRQSKSDWDIWAAKA